MTRVIRAGGIAGILLGGSVAWAGPVETDAAFGERVRTYLLNNPEVILEVMDILAAEQEERATAALLEPHLDTLFATEMDLRMGAADAPRVIVEFFDYNCAVCKANVPAMEAFVAANPDVAIVKKHLPILSPGSERAARFVLAARAAYDAETASALHEAIYAEMGPLNLARLGAYAQELGLDPALIETGMQADPISAVIDTHRDVAVALGVIGTPTFISPQTMHVGEVTAEILRDLADDV